jgi:hypothetical protein
MDRINLSTYRSGMLVLHLNVGWLLERWLLFQTLVYLSINLVLQTLAFFFQRWISHLIQLNSCTTSKVHPILFRVPVADRHRPGFLRKYTGARQSGSTPERDSPAIFHLHKEDQMAITDTLFNEQVGGGDFVASIGVPVPLEVRCPECGEPLRMGTLDLQATGGYSIPFVICKNNCDLRGYAF